MRKILCWLGFHAWEEAISMVVIGGLLVICK